MAWTKGTRSEFAQVFSTTNARRRLRASDAKAPRTYRRTSLRARSGGNSSEGKLRLPWRQTEPLLAVGELRMPGLHNRANALAALAIGSALGLDLTAMLDTLRNFRGLPHRTEFVAEHDGVTWYNDSKGTNVGATVAALRGLDRGDDSRTVLIAGGNNRRGGRGGPFLPQAIQRKLEPTSTNNEIAIHLLWE